MSFYCTRTVVGRVRLGRPLLSRPRGAVGSGRPGLRILSRPRFRPSRGRAGVSLGLDVCEVRLCDPCARVRPCIPCVSRVPAPPYVFLPTPLCLFTGKKTPGGAGTYPPAYLGLPFRELNSWDSRDVWPSPVSHVCVCEFQNRTTQNSGAQAGASPGGRAYMTTGKRPAASGARVWT